MWESWSVTSWRGRALIGWGAWPQCLPSELRTGAARTSASHQRRRKFVVENTDLFVRFHYCVDKSTQSSCRNTLWPYSESLEQVGGVYVAIFRVVLNKGTCQRQQLGLLSSANWSEETRLFFTFGCISRFPCVSPFSSCENFTMKTEVSTAANFVTRLLRGTRLLSEEQLQQFRSSLEEALGGKKGSDVSFPLFRSNSTASWHKLSSLWSNWTLFGNKADEGLLKLEPFLWLKAPETLAKNCKCHISLHQNLIFSFFIADHYQHHWFPNAPYRGSGYRCIRINHKMDPLIGKAACTIGLTKEQLFSLLPSELTMWVDPYEVSYRIGEDGSICVLYESAPPSDTNQADSCKDELRIGRASPSKSYGMMTCSSWRAMLCN